AAPGKERPRPGPLAAARGRDRDHPRHLLAERAASALSPRRAARQQSPGLPPEPRPAAASADERPRRRSGRRAAGRGGELGMARSHGTGAFSREQFAVLGEDVVFETGVLVFHPETIEIGSAVYGGHYTILKGYHRNKMTIGDGTWIGQ